MYRPPLQGRQGGVYPSEAMAEAERYPAPPRDVEAVKTDTPHGRLMEDLEAVKSYGPHGRLMEAVKNRQPHETLEVSEQESSGGETSEVTGRTENVDLQAAKNQRSKKVQGKTQAEATEVKSKAEALEESIQKVGNGHQPSKKFKVR